MDPLNLTEIIITQSINLDRDEAGVLSPLASVRYADSLLVNLEIRHLAIHGGIFLQKKNWFMNKTLGWGGVQGQVKGSV